MRVIYRPAVRTGMDGGQGFFMDDEIILLPVDVATDIRDDIWEKLEKEPTVARMLASGELQPA